MKSLGGSGCRSPGVLGYWEQNPPAKHRWEGLLLGRRPAYSKDWGQDDLGWKVPHVDIRIYLSFNRCKSKKILISTIKDLGKKYRKVLFFFANKTFFFLVGRDSGLASGPNFPSPWATMWALHLDCSATALATPKKVLPIWKLVELKMLDISGHTRTDISILTSATDQVIHFRHFFKSIIRVCFWQL